MRNQNGWVICIDGLNGWKPLNRTIYRLMQDAKDACARLNARQTGHFKVFDSGDRTLTFGP